ncbi:hypothetical protein [Neorhizobium sp. DT-125]|uniref:hypothetical protein n=1 Tax=Neorhizobium sp. DT-125 TaxID=3396163 RepID=UPI003F193046
MDAIERAARALFDHERETFRQGLAEHKISETSSLDDSGSWVDECERVRLAYLRRGCAVVMAALQALSDDAEPGLINLTPAVLETAGKCLFDTEQGEIMYAIADHDASGDQAFGDAIGRDIPEWEKETEELRAGYRRRAEAMLIAALAEAEPAPHG